MSESKPWPSKPLADLTDPTRPICYGVLKPGDNIPSGVPIVRIVDIEGDVVEVESLYRVSTLLDRSFARSRLQGGELLFSIQGTIGRIAIAPDSLKDANISRTIARVGIAEPNRPEFIRHWFRCEGGQRALLDLITGSTRASVNIGDLRTVLVPCPEPIEQRQIAEILDTADEAIQKTEALIAKLKQMQAGLLHDLLTRGIDKNGGLRPSHKTQTNELPNGWRRDLAMRFCDDVTVGVVCNATRHYVKVGVPFLRSQNVRPNHLDSTELLYITPQFNKLQGKSILQTNDVIITRTGANIGMACTVPSVFEGANCFSLVVVRPKKLDLDGHYLSYFLNSEIGKRLIAQKYFGSAQANFNVGEMKELFLTVPPLEEQQEMVRRLKAIERRIDNEVRVVGKLRKAKAGLMNDLLTGKKRINQPTPASV